MTPDENVVEQLYPAIRWHEPIRITRTDGVSRLVCRYCIALRGLKGQDLDQWPETREEFDKHMREEHGK